MDEETILIGRDAYIAYLSFPGAPMPGWDELSEAQQKAWMHFGRLMQKNMRGGK